MTAPRFVVLCLAVVAAIATAFAPSEPPTSVNSKWSAKTSTYTPMKRVGFATPPPSFNRNHCSNGVCMSSDPKSDSDGTVYDDEPILEPPRDPLSNSMKERLAREASIGLDSDKSQTNVILYISVVVALLVALGGQGILY
ncbi:hypothetical protein ACHAW5_007299 [Stephanodiscus triporus]|uniref:Uncharacterized protein n=1 Tax=Stephanodiscus triporus TaxID=2934178 RepID=A0ABD3NIY6_9STRA